MAHRIDRHMLDDPVSRAKDQGVPSAWRAQRISPLRGLEIEDEVDGPLDHRPHDLGEAVVAGEEDVVPHAGGDVGADVGVELVVLDAAVDVVLVPGAVGPLQRRPATRRPVRLAATRPPSGEGHGRLDVVPRVGVAAGEPRDHAARQLPLGDGVDRLGQLCGGDDRRRRQAAWSTSGLRAYTTKLFPINGLASRSTVRVKAGARMMSHTSSRW